MRKLLLALLLAAPFATPLATMAQSGAITPQLLSKFRKQSSSKADLAIQNALIVNGIDMMDTKPNTAELNDT